jgi:NADPH-dependent glutamate synthase beta subunit-like oxidoreductase/NAD(P)H-flavin reductase
LEVNYTPETDPELTLGIPGFTYTDLYLPEKLAELLAVFDAFLAQSDPEITREYMAYRDCKGEGMTAQAVSDVLVRVAPYIGEFVAKLFQIEDIRAGQQAAIRDEVETIFSFRNEIVEKLSAKFKDMDVSSWNIQQLNDQLELLIRAAFPLACKDADQERKICRVGMQLARLSDHFHAVNKGGVGKIADADARIAELRKLLQTDNQGKQMFSKILAEHDPAVFIDSLLDIIQRWAYAALNNSDLNKIITGWVCFKTPKKTDQDHLVQHEIRQRTGFTTWIGNEAEHRRRDGFALTDPRFNQRQVQYEVNHCIYCHDRDTDSCSKGMRSKRGGDFKKNSLGVTIIGCPLGEKISEMHVIKRQGDNIAALALVVLDNPMCPGTGHRICNDCMRGCIYQKTEPVNIPQIETNVLTDVLFMPYGFEIYSLLTRWNPLNVNRPYALPYNGKNILVVGMGPAGYTLAHYLINEGFAVVGIDALKIEPLPEVLIGKNGAVTNPIRDFRRLYEDLDNRLLAGFGGVAEYGITVRWDKNFLKVIYLTLARRDTFRCYGGVRFGGTITVEEAWDMGFDHIAIASGAGKPTIIGLKNNLIRGIRKASDFLMALQLTGAGKQSSLANLQVRLPAGVIGGGLTALDTTTEVTAYYSVQVEKILSRYSKLIKERGEATVRAEYDKEELIILDEFLAHGREIQAERQRSKNAGEKPDFQPLIDAWGGVTLFYRKGIKDSPAYRQNHEEIHEALKEGIQLGEGMNPLEAIADEYQALKAVKFEKLTEKEGKWISEGIEIEVPLRSLFIAAGTSPNTIYEQEHPYSFRMDAKFFQRYEPHWNGNNLPELVPMDDTPIPKIGRPAPMTSYHKNGKFISFYGDNHPVYAGNVVKAMASAKDGYPYIVRLFENEIRLQDPQQQAVRKQARLELFRRLDEEFTATVTEVNRLTPTIIEVIVHAPRQARKFHPGQFYRVQNLECLAPTVNDTVLAAEGLALTGAWVDKEKGLISLIALEMGSSSKLCALWKPGDPLVVMGVTGTPTEITTNKTVMLIGGGLGNAVQFSIGKALRAMGNKVIYFAGYKKPTDVFKVKDIEAASDVIVWSTEPAPDIEPIPTTRPQDKSCIGNILDAIEAYARGDLGKTQINLMDVDHTIVIGSDRMMAAVKSARYDRLKPYLKPGHTAIGSINSPMQCMMKGVCAQCLCKHVDPHTGEEYFVYSCYNQDQDLDHVDFQNLNARLRQNSVQEKLSNMWLDHVLEKHA